MATHTGPPTGTISYMTPFAIADDPLPPKPIPNVVNPKSSPLERALVRFSLDGERAIVTGGAQGLGLVCARALLEHGVTYLAIFDVDDEMGALAVKHLRTVTKDEMPNIVSRKFDVTEEGAMNTAVHEVSDLFDGIQILLSFAGITGCQLAVDYNISEWKGIVDVILNGSFLVARAVARDIIARRSSGSIVFFASMSGHIVDTPQPHPAYSVSKAAVLHLTRSMAVEWVGHNIRVNFIYPGIMNTRLSGGSSQAGLR